MVGLIIITNKALCFIFYLFFIASNSEVSLRPVRKVELFLSANKLPHDHHSAIAEQADSITRYYCVFLFDFRPDFRYSIFFVFQISNVNFCGVVDATLPVTVHHVVT